MFNKVICNEGWVYAIKLKDNSYKGIDKHLLTQPLRKQQSRTIITITNEEIKEGFTTEKNFIKLLNKIYKRYGLTDEEIATIQYASGVKDLLNDDDYYEIFGG